jgi:predicted ester cyclase
VSEQRVRRYWEGFWSKGDRSAVDELYAPTFRLNGEELGRDEWLAEAESWRAHFTDMSVEVDRLFSCGETVVSRVVYRGRHSADFKLVPATGKEFELTGLDVFEFEEGCVVDHWHETDHLDLFRQLGAEIRPASG